MTEGLSAREVRALADMFPDSMSSGPLLASIGLPRRDQPGWIGMTAELWWSEVSRLLADGRVRNGRRRLFDEARTRFPANPIFTPVGEPRRQDVRSGPAVWSVPPRLARFVGRDGQLAELESKLAAGSLVSVVALAGMGGVGKTALAVEYAYRHADEFDVVWWVPAEHPELVPGYLAALGEALDLTPAAETAAVFAELRRRRARWLLVFDNAEDVATVTPFRPTDSQDRGRMLVTSRRIAWRALGATVHVPKLKRSESLALLAGHLPKCDPEAADRVSALLGDLALAVEQVAAFCEQTGTTLPKVVGLLTDRLEEAIELGEVADQTGVTVATLWELSRARLIATAPAAAELLDLLALCAPEPLPLDLFEGSTNAFFGHAPLAHISQDQIAWVQTVGALVGYSLINRENYSLINRETSAIWVHRLVQAATRRHMGQIRRVELLAALGGILFADLPQDLHDRRTWSRWRELLPHVRAFLGHMEDLGDTFDIAGAFASEGPEQPVLVEVFARTLSWLCDRCASYLQLFGQTREALPLFQRALAIHEAAGDANDSVTAIRLNNLANVLIDLDRLEEAEELLLRAVARSEATRGADHPDVADALDNLARTLYKQRRPLEALALLRRSVAILEISLGPEHPKVADRLSNVAMVANSIGLPNDALPLIRRAMAIHEAADGHTHHVAADLNNLAEAHLLLGQAEEALPHFLRALEIDEAVFGPNHPAVASDLHNLAQAQVLAGRLDEAEAALRRALAVGEELHGTDDPAIIPDLAGLARVLLLIEKRAEAAGLYRRALPLAEAAYGTDDPRYHEIRVWLAMIS